MVTFTAQGKRDEVVAAEETFVVTNYSEDLALSGTEAGAANIAAVLATLIKVLQQKGIVKGTTDT